MRFQSRLVKAKEFRRAFKERFQIDAMRSHMLMSPAAINGPGLFTIPLDDNDAIEELTLVSLLMHRLDAAVTADSKG